MLNRRVGLTLTLLSLIFAAAPILADDAAGFKAIFDGKTLEGWEGNPEFWSVEEGAITGRTTAEKPTRGNTFLIWRGGEPANFELRMKFRIVGGNSGIQYRSKDHGNFVVGGYQADFDGGNAWTGTLYEERGRGVLAKRGEKIEIGADGKKENKGVTTEEKVIVDSVQKEGWNDYVIVAQGNRLIQKVNGHVTIDVVDNQSDKAATQGVIALQLHAGPPMLVQFKDIQLKTLD